MKWEGTRGDYQAGPWRIFRTVEYPPWRAIRTGIRKAMKDFLTLKEAKQWVEQVAERYDAEEADRNAELEAVADSQAAEEEVRHELQGTRS